jgi:hypothetical protein
MAYSDRHGEFFGRATEDGNVATLSPADAASLGIEVEG